MTARVLVSEPLAQEGIDRLRERVEVDYRPDLTPDELLAAIGGYDALVVRSGTRVTRRVIEAGRRLRIIGRAGVGVDNIDTQAATEQGIVVVNAPDGNTIAATEQTFTLMLALARNLPQAVASLAAGRWERSRFTGVELYGKTLAVIGLGRIGQEVARRALAFGMVVVAYDPFVGEAQAAKLGVELVSLEEACRRADFLTVHTPLTPQTRHLIGQREIALMKPGVRLINCARGGIIDEAALYRSLEEGRVAGAALDVFEEEPPRNNPLVGHPRVVATPHLGASTVEAQVTCALIVAEEILRHFDGLPVRNAVNLPAIPEAQWEAVAPLLPLAEALGRFFAQALPGPLERVEVTVRGAADGRAADAIGNRAVAGLLAEVLGEPVNAVSAPVRARQRGIEVRVTRVPEDQGGAPAVAIAAGGGGEYHTLSGHIGALGDPRITAIDGYVLDMAPARHMLVAFHRDRPGVIGRVGTILGEHAVNIAGMYVGRAAPGGDAVMVLAVDDPIPGDLLQRIREVPAIGEVRVVSLPPDLARP
ncbi:MAG: phosphoglycerate dehydrogenase [Clostridia bacterium]|nr:phosphoglycerate dehydrogenase [Clostridia bacterium]